MKVTLRSSRNGCGTQSAVVILKQWNEAEDDTERNLMKLNKYTHANLSDEKYIQCCQFSPGVVQKVRRCGKLSAVPKSSGHNTKDRPGAGQILLAYYLSRMQ